MENPNEYDDEAYLKASNRLINDVAGGVSAMWAAGANVENIEEALVDGFANSDSDLNGDTTVSVTVSVIHNG